MDVAFVVRDENALPFALEQAGLAHDALRAVHSDGLLPTELELGRDGGIVDDIRKSVPWLQVEYGDRTHVFAMRATGTPSEFDIDQDHAASSRPVPPGDAI
jgi:hypothetical protein